MRLLFLHKVIQGWSQKNVSNISLKVFYSALYYYNKIKKKRFALNAVDIIMSHRRGGQLCEWYKISKKLIKSLNLCGSLILNNQWIQKDVTHHCIGLWTKTKDIFIIKKNRQPLCNGVTAELINLKIKFKKKNKKSLPNNCFKLLHTKAI